MGPDRGQLAHPYGELIELAERESALIATRDFAGLTGLVETREHLIADLPEKAPEDAHDAIRDLMELQKQNDSAIQQAAQGLEVELSRLRSGRAGVRRYAPAVAAPAKRLDYTA